MKRAVVIGMILAMTAGTAWAQSARPAPRARVAPTLQLLNQRIPEVAFEDAPLERVVDWLKTFTKSNVVVRWEKLENNGVERDKAINIKVRNVTLSMVLWMVLNDAGGDDVKLAYKANKDVLIISTVEDLGQEMIVRVYDVTDLLINIPRFTNAPRIDVSQALQGGAGGGGGGGGNVFESNDDEREENDQGAAFAAPGSAELIALIVSTIDPDSWEVNGGTGQIIPFRTSLVVRNTLLVHQKLNGYVTEELVEAP
ncbi:MAG: hypothetical protein HRU75_01055 [Planctomycetia bacterium]|nr:MAG: hypothetical protein HRU75_01055 [Planctomycetia bacterium]